MSREEESSSVLSVSQDTQLRKKLLLVIPEVSLVLMVKEV